MKKKLVTPALLTYITFRAGERSLKKLSGFARTQFHRVVGAPRSFYDRGDFLFRGMPGFASFQAGGFIVK
ncbi:MAG: hypothetical protein EGQ81_05685 [Akkermansia sp.]|nr:hypothetical protein [Akkermansia sp.]